MKEKRRKKRIITVEGCLILLLLLIAGTTLFVHGSKESEIQKKEVEYPEEQTITCFKEQGHDEAEETEIVYLQKGKLIRRENIVDWTNSPSKERTCEYYTKNSAGLNSYKGVSSTCNCGDSYGHYTATYVIAELDREEVRLKQFDYLNENDIFSAAQWRIYMEERNFKCTES